MERKFMTNVLVGSNFENDPRFDWPWKRAQWNLEHDSYLAAFQHASKLAFETHERMTDETTAAFAKIKHNLSYWHENMPLGSEFRVTVSNRHESGPDFLCLAIFIEPMHIEGDCDCSGCRDEAENAYLRQYEH